MQLGSTELALVSVLIVLGLVVPLVLAVSRTKRARAVAVALILVGCLVAALGFWRGSGFLLTFSGVTPFPFSLAIDRLSAFFLLLICTVAAPVAIFAFTY